MAFFMRDAFDANSTDDYRPKTTPEKAGCPGTGAAVTSDPNYTFASTMKAGLEKTPYPTGGGGGAASLDTVAAVETTATTSVSNVVPNVLSVTPATGLAAGGTAVTIRGSSFTGTTGSGVKFGPTAATSVVVVNDGTITCTSPAKTAGAYDVTVTTPNGTSGAGVQFTYT
jgi:hypothetical protein